MPKNTNNLGPLEKKVMQAIWEKNCCDVRSVLNEVSGEKKMAYTTVMTIMTRLVQKGVLQRKKEGKTYCYTPKESKQLFVNDLVQQTMNNFISKFGNEAIVAFMNQSTKLSQKDKEVLLKKLQK